jgi:hypothetical protein
VLSLLAEVSSPEWTWLTSAGPTGILAAVVIGFWKGWIVSGSTHTQLRQASEAEAGRLREERDRALAQVYKQAEIAQRALEALERKTVA